MARHKNIQLADILTEAEVGEAHPRERIVVPPTLRDCLHSNAFTVTDWATVNVALKLDLYRSEVGFVPHFRSEVGLVPQKKNVNLTIVCQA